MVIGLCWWFSMTAKLISCFLRYCWHFFTVFCWLNSLAQKKIEILCLLGVKDSYESPFVYVWTLDFHCFINLVLVWLSMFQVFSHYYGRWTPSSIPPLWNYLLLNWSDNAKSPIRKEQLCYCFCKYHLKRIAGVGSNSR